MFLKEKLLELSRASSSINVVLSMPKTGSTKAEKELDALHLHTLYCQKTTRFSPGAQRNFAAYLFELMYKFLLRSFLARRKRKYFIYCRPESDRIVSAFFQDFYFCLAEKVKDGTFDSRDATEDKFLKLFIESTDFEYKKKWIENLSKYLNMFEKDIKKIMNKGEREFCEVMTDKGMVYFLPMGSSVNISSSGCVTKVIDIHHQSKRINASEQKFYHCIYIQFKERFVHEAQARINNS